MRLWPLTISILLASVLAAESATVRVPADAPTIQAGINAASYGDSVVVSCGTYFEHDVEMKSGVVLRSFNGDPSCVTIDADRASRVLYISTCDSSTVIEGITLHDGYDYEGAGAYIRYSEPKFLRCRFTENLIQPSGVGAAIYAAFSRVRLEECTIARNERAPGYGVGGTITYYTSLTNPMTLRNCTITGNTAGPILQPQWSTPAPRIDRSIIAMNSGQAWGSALVTCSDIFGNPPGTYLPGSTGNFSADPQFCDAPAANYTLRSGSPCLPGGNPCNILVGAHGVGCGPVFPVSVTVTTLPPGLPMTIDGVARTSPATFVWLQYSRHKVAVHSMIENPVGSALTFVSWTDGGAPSHTITVPAAPSTFTATYKRQFFLTMGAQGAGIVTPSSGWRDTSSVVSIVASPVAGNAFSLWTGTGTGSYSGTNNPASVTMRSPISETATFVLLPPPPVPGYRFSISSSATNPSENVSTPTGGARSIYLWMTCSDAGLSALETGVQGTLTPLGFNPANGVFNVGSASSLLLAVQAVHPRQPDPSSSDRGSSGIPGARSASVPRRPDSSAPSTATDSIPISPLNPRLHRIQLHDERALRERGTVGCIHGGAARSTDSRDRNVARSDIDADFQLSVPAPESLHRKHGARAPRPGVANVACAVYDVTGRVVRVLHDGLVESGRTRIAWEGTDDRGRRVAPGIYFVRAQANERVVTRKVSLVSDGR